MTAPHPRVFVFFGSKANENASRASKRKLGEQGKALRPEVSDIQLLQNELPIEAVYDKQAVFDISCSLDGRRHVNIEMQGINIDNALVSFGSEANKTEGGSQGVKIEQSLYLPPLRTS